MNTASAGNNAAVQASIASTSTTLDAGAYKINFTIATLSGIELTQNDDGTLYRGIYNNSGSAVQRTAVTGETKANCMKAVTITAEWAVTPTDEADVAYLKGKTITGATLTAEGNVKLISSADYGDLTGVADATTQAITVTVGASNVASLTVTVADVYARIKTNNEAGPEFFESAEGENLYGQTAAQNTSAGAVYHSADKLSIAAVDTLTIA